MQPTGKEKYNRAKLPYTKGLTYEFTRECVRIRYREDVVVACDVETAKQEARKLIEKYI